jgi:hypothetical protein
MKAGPQAPGPIAIWLGEPIWSYDPHGSGTHGQTTMIHFSRRKFLAAATASVPLALAHHSYVTGAASASGQADTFDARNAMRFANLPDLRPHGLKDVTVVYASELWPKNSPRSEPDISYIQSRAIPRVRKKAADLVVIDVEHWDLAGTSSDRIDRNIRRYVTLLETFRANLPGIRHGLYSMIPVRNYWTPVKGKPAAMSDWRAENERLKPIAEASDIIFPSLYTFYDDRDGWLTYAKANMEEAKRYGRPIYPFLWPQYHESWKPIDRDFWRLQLETVFDNADGMVIWTPAKGRPRWNPEAPWWQETVDFLNASGLSRS